MGGQAGAGGEGEGLLPSPVEEMGRRASQQEEASGEKLTAETGADTGVSRCTSPRSYSHHLICFSCEVL